jgi:alkylated DNA repair dioxygenase AlkB
MSYQPSLFDSPLSPLSSPSSPTSTVESADELQSHLISLPGGEVMYYPRWLFSSSLNASASTHSQALYQTLKQQVEWEQTEIVLYGKTLRIPRLNAWYADPQCGYTYSGQYFEPLPWLPILQLIKTAVEATLAPLLQGISFNSALVNCYRDGQDSVAWHSDDEPELGQNPIVASVSLGAERLFQLRHKQLKGDADRHAIALLDGDLLFMYGAMQHHWQHQIPKTRKPVGERINITFRYIKYPASKKTQ